MNPDDKDLQQLEEKLQQLRPSEPSEKLIARIFGAFETPSDAAPAAVENVVPMKTPPARSWAQPFAAAAAVALLAGVVALIGLNRNPAVTEAETVVTPVDATPVKFIPAHAQNTYRGSNVDQIVFTKDRVPMQAVRHQFTDTYTWENPADGSRVQIEIPVERVRYIPVPTD